MTWNLHKWIRNFVKCAHSGLKQLGLINVEWSEDILNLTFTFPKCLKYRNKVKDHNSQTQKYFIKFLLLLIYSKNFIKYCCVWLLWSFPLFLEDTFSCKIFCCRDVLIFSEECRHARLRNYLFFHIFLTRKYGVIRQFWSRLERQPIHIFDGRKRSLPPTHNKSVRK